MKQLSVLWSALAGVLLLSTNASAQKPVPNAALEIKLPAENESYHFVGNNRVLDRNNLPVALYNVNYKVQAAQPLQMALQYLRANKGILGLNDDDIDNGLVLHHVRDDDGGTIVRLRQTYKGIPVNRNAEITIHINKDRVIDFVMNGYRNGINLQSTTPVISAATARQRVAAHLNITGNISFESNDLMVLQHNGSGRLVHKVVILCDQPVGEWECFVDAQTGALLKVEDIAFYHHSSKKRFTPFMPDALQVAGIGNVFDPDPLTTAKVAYGGSYVDGSDANAAVLTAQLKSVSLPDITLAAGVYSLVGPYASIQDNEAPNKGLFTQATSTFNFDRSADAFEAVNCYYHIDAAMRYLNTTLGVTVMPYRYTGGVKYDPSGLSGADNSHYTSSNGALAFGEGGVDDAEDADVIIHELGHGIHDWITVGGLSQVNGLSEGTGDYWAGSYSRNLGSWTPADAAYNWTFNWDGHNPFWGGRILNYTPIYPAGLVNQIHTDGQIWATANMKIWDDIGRQKADKVFWKGLSMTNSSSSQNDAAVAVYNMASTLGYTNTERLAIHTRYTAAGYTLPSFSLPMKVVSFTANKQQAQVAVKWTVSNETTGSTYTIERAADGLHFSSLKQVSAIANDRTNSYSIVDEDPINGKNYYRLKETMPDGSVSYSNIVMIEMQTQWMRIFPNPAKDHVNIRCSGLKGNATLTLIDAAGKTIWQKTYANATVIDDMIDVSHLPSGVYRYKIENQGKMSMQQLTIVK